MNLEEVKLYAKSDEDIEINSFQLAAEIYLTNAGIVKNYESELYKLAVKMMVSNWNDNRGVDKTEALNKISYSLSSIITQLQLEGD